jgi:TP901 family phage tail tape measure protein
MVNLGGLTAYLRVDMRDLQTKLTRATQQIKNFSIKSENFLKAQQHNFRRAGLAVVAFVGVTIKAFSSFEKELANVSTMLDDHTMHYVPQYTKQLKAMAVEFGESTATLSKGLYDILSASIAPAKAMNVLAASTKAAKAGLTDTAVAADAITTILNAYQLSADKASQVSDWLFAVVKRGKTTFAELAPNIGKVTAIAAVAGLSFEELGAAIATMTRAGLQTDLATTSMRGLLNAFLKPADDAKEVAKQFGFELNTSTLRAIGLTGVLKKLKGATAEQLASLIPNVRGLAGFAAALQQAEGQASDYALMLNSAGLTQKAFDKMTKTLSHSLSQFWQKIKITAVTIGEQYAQSIDKATKSIGKLTEELRDFIELEGPTIALWTKLTVGAIGFAIIAPKVTAAIYGIGGALTWLGKHPTLSIFSGALAAGTLTYGLLKRGADETMQALTKEIEAFQEANDSIKESSTEVARLQKEVLALRKKINETEENSAERSEAMTVALERELELERARLDLRTKLVEEAYKPQVSFGLGGVVTDVTTNLSREQKQAILEQKYQSEARIKQLEQELLQLKKITAETKNQIARKKELQKYDEFLVEITKKSGDMQAELRAEELADYDTIAAKKTELELEYNRKREEIEKDFDERQKVFNDYKVNQLYQADLKALENWRRSKLKAINDSAKEEINIFLQTKLKQSITNIEQERDRLLTYAQTENERVAITKRAQDKITAIIREATDRAKKIEKDRLEEIAQLEQQRLQTIRSIYSDISGGKMNEGLYQAEKALLDLQLEEYRKFINDKYLLDQWYAEQLRQLNRQRLGIDDVAVIKMVEDEINRIRQLDYLTRNERIANLEAFRDKHAEVLSQVKEAEELLNDEIRSIYQSRLNQLRLYFVSLQEDMKNTSLFIADKFAIAFENIEGGMSDMLVSWMDGTASMKEDFNDFVRSITGSFQRMIADFIARWLMMKMITGFMPQLAPIMGAGLQPMAAGGIITQPTPVLAGEEGDEAFVPLDQNRKIPVELKDSQAGEVHHHYHINAVDAPSFVALLSRSGNALTTIVQKNMRLNHPSRRG